MRTSTPGLLRTRIEMVCSGAECADGGAMVRLLLLLPT